jgi:pyruvate ferredoxin oxidoreductase delta subunit
MAKKVAISRPSEGASGLTGMWRIKRPVMDKTKCTNCLLCWLYCPEAAIKRHNDGTLSISYDFCKGCGICAEVCPAKAIVIVREA